MGLDFEIRYKPGQDNSVADALSRRMTYAAFSRVQFEELEDWEKEIQNDPKLQRIIQNLMLDASAHPGYTFKDRKLFFIDRLVLPKGSSRIPNLLKDYHSSAVGGHSRFFRTYKRIYAIIYWEGMRKDIQQIVATCETCQLNKYQTLSPTGLLQPLPIPTQVWTDISMDFIEGLPKAHGKKCNSGGRGSFNKICSFHSSKSSIHSQGCCGKFHQRGDQVAWFSFNHCIRQRQDISQSLLV